MIAILGAAGQVGSALVRLLGDACIAATRRDLDISDPGAIRPWIRETRPRLLINCAAYTDVDRAETEQELAYLVNGAAVGELAASCLAIGTTFATLSTDYVFDGRKDSEYLESDEPHPINVYGASKLEGERLALEANPDALVIRTSWVLSHTHNNFVTRMIALLEVDTVRVVDDQTGHPTIADDLAAAIVKATKKSARGVLHVTNQGKTTWFQLAREIADLAGLDPERVESCSSSDLARPAPRPRNSALGSERLNVFGLSPLSSYHGSLEALVERLRAAGGSDPTLQPSDPLT